MLAREDVRAAAGFRQTRFPAAEDSLASARSPRTRIPTRARTPAAPRLLSLSSVGALLCAHSRGESFAPRLLDSAESAPRLLPDSESARGRGAGAAERTGAWRGAVGRGALVGQDAGHGFVTPRRESPRGGAAEAVAPPDRSPCGALRAIVCRGAAAWGREERAWSCVEAAAKRKADAETGVPGLKWASAGA